MRTKTNSYMHTSMCIPVHDQEPLRQTEGGRGEPVRVQSLEHPVALDVLFPQVLASPYKRTEGHDARDVDPPTDRVVVVVGHIYTQVGQENKEDADALW